MGKRHYQCTACREKHERPINRKCPFVSNEQEEDSDSDSYIEPAQPMPVEDTQEEEEQQTVTLDIGDKILGKLESMETQLNALSEQVRHNRQTPTQSTDSNYLCSS